MAGSYINRRPWGQQKPPPGYQLDRSSPFASNLVTQLLFNENSGAFANDLSSYKCNGTILNGEWRENSLYFNGASTVVNTTENPILEMSTHNLSIIVRCKRDTSIANMSLIGGDQLAPNILLAPTTYKPLFGSTFSSVADAANTAVPAGQWTHVAVVFDNIATTNNLNYYYNGKPDGTFTYNINFTAGRLLNQVGILTDDQPRWFQGLIDYVMIYRDRLLSAAEVAFLYANPYDMVEGWNYARYYSITGAAGIVFSPIWYQNSVQDVA